jgi:predicted outer membrane repeat protein
MKSRIECTIHVISAVLMTVCAASPAAVYYVSPEGDNTAGQSWATGFTHIQTAIDAAGTTGLDVIRIKKGTYAITAPILVTKPVTLSGGYSGEAEERNPAVFVTLVQGNDSVIHCFHVTANATFDGLWITKGYAFGSPPNNQGGGMYIDGCDPVIYGCTFQDNYADHIGGAIYARFSGASISDCSFVQNVAGDHGGAIYAFQSGLTITDCTFTGNKGQRRITTRGGAICNEDSSPTITECIFSGNTASEGAGIYNDASDAVIEDCTFGGCDPTSGRGGGIYNYYAAPQIADCLFYSNQVAISGAAIFEGQSSASSIVNCVIRNNSATVQGGGLYTDDSASPSVTNCTIYANSAGSRGGAVFNYYGRPAFTNCILWANTAAMGGAGICNEDDFTGSAAVVRYSDVQGSSVYPGTGNILADPAFVYPAGDDLHLTDDSPCIDAGNNEVSNVAFEDMEDHPRIVDGDLDGTATVDMGAYEVQTGLRISDHLQWVHLFQGQVYDSPFAMTPDYMFLLELETDDTVDHIEFLTPMGYVYTISNAPYASSGGIQTRHTAAGDTQGWLYWGGFTDAVSLGRYGDGNYLIILYYNNGSTQQTNVFYTLPGTYDTIAFPTQRPSVVAPQDQAGVASPVTFAWNTCTDTSVNSIFLGIMDADTGATVTGTSLPPSATGSEPISLDEGRYKVELAFQRFYRTTTGDGIDFEYGKSLAVRRQFEVLYTTVYRFWSPITGSHFYTASEDERAALIADYPYAWTYEGPVFKACVTACHPGLAPVYRFWSSVSGSHFYTISEAEKDYVINNYPTVWTFEDAVFYAYPEGTQPAGSQPVYRFWSAATSSHFYTMSEEEKNYVVDNYPSIWTFEGIAFYAYP